MQLFENVKVEKNANVYFDGRVTSRNIFFTDGTKKTLGVMLPGSYEFGTEKKRNYGNSIWNSKSIITRRDRVGRY